MQSNCYWPYISNLAGSLSKAKFLPLRKNLLGSKRKANNNYFTKRIYNTLSIYEVCFVGSTWILLVQWKIL